MPFHPVWGSRVYLLTTIVLLSLGCEIDDFSDGPPKDISQEDTVFQTFSLPRDNTTKGIDFRYMTSVGNGHLATVVYSDTIYVNGLYNGAMGWSHRARIPSTQAIRVRVGGGLHCNVTRKYSLDLSRGVFEEVVDVDGMRGRITQRTYAHQRYTRLLVTEILIDRQSEAEMPIVVHLHNNPGNDSGDIQMSEPVNFTNNVWPSYQQNGTIIKGELNQTSQGGNGLQNVSIFSTSLPESLTLPSGEQTGRWFFFTSIDQSYTTAKEEFQRGLNLTQDAPDYLYQSHLEAWRSKWSRGRIEVSGNLKLQKLIYGSFYYLLSSLPSTEPNLVANQFYGLSPGGLANGANATDYQGHVFWDMETWMYPTMLMFHPELAKEMLSYRIHGMEYAYDRARKGGYVGLRYPWESGFTGVEVTPDVCVPCRENQQHITGDIALAARQYVTATRDSDWLVSGKGYQLIRDIGLFWATRATYDEEKDAYEINGVMPPDEYAIFVNNSVYTNVLAAKSIRFARYAACLSGLNYTREINETLISIANNIFIPFNQAAGFHPEFEGYESYYNGTPVVKQADVILLGYPIMYEMDRDVRRKDLEMYEAVTDENGPAMTWGMFAIGWLELGDEARAAGLFDKAHSSFTREPFKIWTEARSGIGAVNFITGMGGFLQAVFFGYGGARLHEEQLTFDPKLPPGTDGMKFIDVDYLGSRFDINIKPEVIQINVSHAVEGEELILTVSRTGSQFRMTKGRLIDMDREAFTLEGSDVTGCPLSEGPVCPVVIGRREWSSSVMEEAVSLVHPVGNVIVYQTGQNCYSKQSCTAEARSQQTSDGHVKYNFFVGEDGSIFEGRGWNLAANHSESFNTRSIAIGLLGNFTTSGPNKRGMAAVKLLIKCGMEIGKINETYSLLGEKQVQVSSCLTCPADKLLCELMTSQRWSNYQLEGAFRPPCCKEVCDTGTVTKVTTPTTATPTPAATPTPTPTPSSSSRPVSSLAGCSVSLMLLMIKSLLI